MAALALRPDRRCLWTERQWAAARLPRCTGKPERRRRQQRRGEPARLFYIIPRHNRDNLSVCTYVRREERWRPVWVGFFKVHSRNISLDFPEYRFHGKKKSAGVRFTFSAISSNYNNELWRSSRTQTPGELA